MRIFSCLCPRLTIELPPETHAAIREFCRSRYRIKHFVNTAMRWFLLQPLYLQHAIMFHYDADNTADEEAAGLLRIVAARITLDALGAEARQKVAQILRENGIKSVEDPLAFSA